VPDIAASRIDPGPVNPHLPAMLCALRDSLADASWPVRDSACTATGRFLRSVWLRINYEYTFAPFIVPIPTAEDIVTGLTQPTIITSEIEGVASSNGSEDKVSVHQLCEESVGLLFSFLSDDPFRPVRDSAAVAVIDAMLPPPLPTSPFPSADGGGSNMRRAVTIRTQEFVASYILSAAAATTGAASSNSSSSGGSGVGGSKVKSKGKGTSTGLTKAIQFIPQAMLIDMQSHAEQVKRASNERSAPIDGGSEKRSEAASEGGGVSWGGNWHGKKRRTKGRVGGGWGCCLDCGPGEGRSVLPWERSEVCVLLLREAGQSWEGLESEREMCEDGSDNYADEVRVVLREIMTDNLQVSKMIERYLRGMIVTDNSNSGDDSNE
jgi:hypothetical protein